MPKCGKIVLPNYTENRVQPVRPGCLDKWSGLKMFETCLRLSTELHADFQVRSLTFLTPLVHTTEEVFLDLEGEGSGCERRGGGSK